jgi:hypothetical protein
MRMVNGGELYLRKNPRSGSRWKINFYEVTLVSNGFLRSYRLRNHLFAGKTFNSPDAAAHAVRRFIAA